MKLPSGKRFVRDLFSSAVETAVMLAARGAFTSQWEDYRGRTRWRLVPGIYRRFVLAFSTIQMSGKIVSRDELLRERERLRAEEKRLVFTNGCFDILHVGHVRYLAEARRLGDALVVAINSDRAVTELKGAGRPVMNEEERAEMLAALRAVDYVTVFDDLSPRSLIQRLLPDVLVKGGDYNLDEIHGRDEVEAAGGRVMSLPFVEGASTSSIIERIKERGTSDKKGRPVL